MNNEIALHIAGAIAVYLHKSGAIAEGAVQWDTPKIADIITREYEKETERLARIKRDADEFFGRGKTT